MSHRLGWAPSLPNQVSGLAQLRSDSVYVCSKTQRANLSARDRMRLQESCEKGLESTFKLMEIKDPAEEIGTMYSLGIQMDELRLALEYNAIEDVFMIIPTREDGTMIDADTKDLFSNYVSLSLDEIRRSTRFYNTRGASYHRQNNVWSLRKIENSCDSELRDKLIERMREIPEIERGGPVGLKIILDLITTTNARAIRSILTKVQTLTLRDFNGEDVLTANGWIRGIKTVLEVGNALPVDFMHLVFNIYKECSTPKFVTKVEMYETHFDEDVGQIKNLDDFFRVAETHYRLLKQQGQWMGGSTKGSVFLNRTDQSGTTGKRDLSKVKCYNCNEMGHLSKDCPKPKKPRAGGTAPTTGGGGTTTQAGKATGGGTSEISKERNKPPKNGEKTREIAGKKWYWCGQCSRWMKTDHVATPKNCPKNSENASSEGSGVHTAATSLPMTGLSG